MNTNIIECALLVVDVQKQYNKPAKLYQKCIDYVNQNREQYDMIIGTVFQNTLGNFYVHLDDTECADATEDDLEYKPDVVFFKHGYGLNLLEKPDAIIYNSSLGINPKDIWNVKYFHIIGCDADAHILATAYNLWDADKDFLILTDYVYTTNLTLLIPSFEIMRRNFGDCLM